MNTIDSFKRLVASKGAPVLYHRERDATACPCRTPEGFRDPTWHFHLFDSISITATFGGVGAAHSSRIIVGAVFGQVELAPISQTFNYTSDAIAVNVAISWLLFDVPPDRINIYRSDDGGPFYLLGTVHSTDPNAALFTDSTPPGSLAGTIVAADTLPITCNAHAMLPVVTEVNFKGFVQPAMATGNRFRGMAEFSAQSFGAIQVDDRIGIFPPSIDGVVLDFTNWSNAGNEFVQFNGVKYNIVNWSAVPAPDDASAIHHFEVGLRRMTKG